nr:Retrovirus-related Pol polyprotein from transposon RE1 [Ipomoea batatas]
MLFTRRVVAECEICQLEKQTTLPFPVRKTWMATEKLLIHTDVCGGKLKVCRDIKFDERWNWDKNKLFENIKEESGELLENERIDDIHVRGTRSLAEIYERRNVAVLEPVGKDDGAEKVDETAYRSIIGCLMFLTSTRPDIMFPISLLSRFLHCTSELHYIAAKRILRLINGTLDHDLKFEKIEKLFLHGYSDSDWAVGSLDDMRSTSGYFFSFGFGCFSWSSTKQDVVVQTTAEAEYVTTALAVNQTLWLRKLLTDLKMTQQEATITGVQLADILTKGLPRSRFEVLREKIRVCSKNSKEE